MEQQGDSGSAIVNYKLEVSFTPCQQNSWFTLLLLHLTRNPYYSLRWESHPSIPSLFRVAKLQKETANISFSTARHDYRVHSFPNPDGNKKLICTKIHRRRRRNGRICRDQLWAIVWHFCAGCCCCFLRLIIEDPLNTHQTPTPSNQT